MLPRVRTQQAGVIAGISNQKRGFVKPTLTFAKGSTSAVKLSAVLMVVLGIAAVVLPGVAGLTISVLFGATVFLAGVAYALIAFSARGTGAFVWRLMVSAVFTIAGAGILIHPGIALVTITLVVAVTFFLEGIAEFASYVSLRDLRGSGLLLLNAVTSVLLAFLIWRNWPLSSAWAIGVLIGVNLISSGLTRLMSASMMSAVAEF